MSSVLDNFRSVHSIDSDDMLGAIYRLPESLVKAPRFSGSSRGGLEPVSSLVLAGMGGSASAADVLLDWLADRIRIPSLVERGPAIPRFVDEETGVVCLSYSGETAETLSAFREARNRRCSMAAVGSGGKLGRICASQSVPFVRVAKALAPRAALGQMVVGGASALQGLGIVRDVRPEILAAGKELRNLREQWSPNVGMVDNNAKRFALLLKDRMPVVYTFQRISSVARRFKNQLAENAKVQAKYDVLPESGHNEVESWIAKNNDYVPVLVRDTYERKEERALMSAFKETIAAATSTKPLEVKIRAETKLARLLAPILFLDYVSTYLALLRNVNPSLTPQIREFKKRYAEKL